MNAAEERDRRVRVAAYVRGKRETIATKQEDVQVLIKTLAAHPDKEWKTLLGVVHDLRDNLHTIRSLEYDILDVLNYIEMTESEALSVEDES